MMHEPKHLENTDGVQQSGESTLPGSARLLARRRHRVRAMALLGTMLVLMLILSFILVGVAANLAGAGPQRSAGNGIAGRAQQLMRTANQRMALNYSINNAETGLWACMQWLNEQSAPPEDTAIFTPKGTSPSGGIRQFLPKLGSGVTNSSNWTNVVLDAKGNSFKVRFYPYSNNSTAANRSYVIESEGSYQGGRKVILRGVATQDTFAKYAFFADEMPTTYYVGGLSRFNGPVHINGTRPEGDTDSKLNIIWKDAANSEIFAFNGNGSFSTALSNDDIDWYKGDGINNVLQTPTNDTEWKRLAKAGRTSIQLGMSAVEMPKLSDRQQEAALNGPKITAPIISGVTIPSSGQGGIYVKGDVEDMVLEAQVSNPATGAFDKQIITIYQIIGALRVRTTITMDPTSNQTTMEKSTSPTNASTWTDISEVTYGGTTNGVVYIDGNVGTQSATESSKKGGLSGDIATNAKLNIVTASDKNLNIDGEIKFAYPYEYTDAATKVTYARPENGILGIVSSKVQVIDKPYDAEKRTNGSTITGTVANNFDVFATIMAYDTFGVTNPDTRAKGYINRLGGTIVTRSSKMGKFNMDNLTLTNGFSVTNNYDDRLINSPPPYFPSTSNLYVLRSVERVTAPLSN
jgi:hypothetical protein